MSEQPAPAAETARQQLTPRLPTPYARTPPRTRASADQFASVLKRRAVSRITMPCAASGRSFSLRWYRSWTRSEKRPQSGHAEPAARPLAATSTVPNAAVTASTSTSSIPSNTSESQNGASVCMTSTITGHNRVQQRVAGT